MDASAHFRGKKITLMGLGVLGRGAGDALYLAKCGAELIVTDLKSEADLADSLAPLKEFSNVSYTLGEHKLEDFQHRDLIVKAAGVPFDSVYIKEAEQNGIPVRMSADLFAEHAGIPVIGVTGTRGKSTTTHMIAHILKEAGKEVILGGNVRGISTLALLDGVKGGEVGVFELDSWQLQGFGALKHSPHIAVFTTFFPDHLNYYHNDLSAYLADKANIFFYQQEGDALILGAQCANLIIEQFGEAIDADISIADPAKLPADLTLSVPGEHNRYDAACALAAVRAYGIDDAVSFKALESFPGVPGRLELIREVNGVKIYNDTNATTPEATLAALEALGENIVLIMGGADKGLDMNKLLVEIPKYAKRIVMLAGTGTNRVLEFVEGASIYDSLDAAVAEAVKAASAGDSILLSPAFASFGMFKNEYDRGDQFNAIVQAL